MKMFVKCFNLHECKEFNLNLLTITVNARCKD